MAVESVKTKPKIKKGGGLLGKVLGGIVGAIAGAATTILTANPAAGAAAGTAAGTALAGAGALAGTAAGAAGTTALTTAGSVLGGAGVGSSLGGVAGGIAGEAIKPTKQTDPRGPSVLESVASSSPEVQAASLRSLSADIAGSSEFSGPEQQELLSTINPALESLQAKLKARRDRVR